VCYCLHSNLSISDVIQETDDWLITSYNKAIIAFLEVQLQANLEPVYSFQGSQEACVDLPASTPVGLCQLQPVPVSLQEVAFHQDR